MNVLFVAQCSKRALTETRRILDQFAERRGDRTWQTPITQQGLDALRRLLRKTARKNTAVAAHWIRGLDHSELLWVVGDASQFNMQGAVPTNTTLRDVLRKDDENDWHSAEAIRLLAAVAALFHDFGKANALFQAKLKPGSSSVKAADPYRHEWVSLRMFEAFVGDHQGSDAGWLERLASIADKPDKSWRPHIYSDGITARKSSQQAYPLAYLPPLAKAVSWLIVTHHRLPQPSAAKAVRAADLPYLLQQIDAQWCGAQEDTDAKRIKQVWDIKPELFPDNSKAWCKRAQKIAQRLIDCKALSTGKSIIDDAYVMHVARMCLILGDHHYSSQAPQPTTQGDDGFPAFANTHDGQLKQRLDDHLIGVEKTSTAIAHALLRAERVWPRLAHHRGFKRRSADPRFSWQDKAFDLVSAMQIKATQQGFFGINMASTGGGKTLANARIAYALADPQRGARFCVALGLRTLTLQTGQAYRERLGLTEETLAVMVGGSASRQLFAHQQAKLRQPLLLQPTDFSAPVLGSESSEALLPDNTHVHFEGALTDGPLSQWLSSGSKQGGSANKLLQAPVLVCTIDHLMPATEATRGGRQIAPMLRLMSSDLVLDEPDDFDLDDLPALSRLVHWAGLLGSRVILSSATLPPAMVQGLFAAYAAGRKVYQANRGQTGLTLDICCAWFDEYGAQASSHAEEASFAQSHEKFVAKRVHHLGEKEVRRRARILPLALKPVGATASERDRIRVREGVAQAAHCAMFELHQLHHTVQATSGQRVSFGLIRMANVDPLIDVACALMRLPAHENYRVHVCVYHSRHPLLMRSAIEARLDRILQRHSDQAVFKDQEITPLLAAHPEQNHVFVVLASPVAEVGRDHDYDWAIVEPSSMRSIIQLAGRVRRHRPGAISQPNVVLLDTNCRALEAPSGAAFKWPGFEDDDKHRLTTHRLASLLREDEWATIDARSRVQPPKNLSPTDRLLDLEHHRLQTLMGDAPTNQFNLRRWWTTPVALSAVDQRTKPFRFDSQGHESFVLLPQGDEDGWNFQRVELDGSFTQQNKQFELCTLPEPASGMQRWGASDYISEVGMLAQAMGLTDAEAGRRYGTVQLPGRPDDTQRWLYHPWLGFRRQK